MRNTHPAIRYLVISVALMFAAVLTALGLAALAPAAAQTGAVPAWLCKTPAAGDTQVTCIRVARRWLIAPDMVGARIGTRQVNETEPASMPLVVIFACASRKWQLVDDNGEAQSPVTTVGSGSLNEQAMGWLCNHDLYADTKPEAPTVRPTRKPPGVSI